MQFVRLLAHEAVISLKNSTKGTNNGRNTKAPRQRAIGRGHLGVPVRYCRGNRDFAGDALFKAQGVIQKPQILKTVAPGIPRTIDQYGSQSDVFAKSQSA